MVRPPRFEPGSPAWEARVLDQARLRPHTRHTYKHQKNKAFSLTVISN
jgi:hypothetical protein